MPGPDHARDVPHQMHGMPQGEAHHKEVHRADHQARGSMSPIGGGRPDPLIITRDEDIASAPMRTHKAGPVPPTNRAGFITPIKGRFPKGQGGGDYT
jgi:hypothetical protein